MSQFDRDDSGFEAESTCWELVGEAAAGDAEAREKVARIYGSIVRACLAARWSGSRFTTEVDEGVQEFFVECFKRGGVIERSAASPPESFRAFLKGVVRNVALRIETDGARKREMPVGSVEALDQVQRRDATVSETFDREWAKSVLREAIALLGSWSARRGDEGRRRAELLELRFREGMPIRDIAVAFGVDPAWLHHEFARARAEFRDAVLEILGRKGVGYRKAAELECDRLLELLRPRARGFDRGGAATPDFDGERVVGPDQGNGCPS